MKNLRRLVVALLVLLATIVGVVAAPPAAAQEEECDYRDVFLAADGSTEVPYFERQVQLSKQSQPPERWVLLQRIGFDFRDSDQLHLPDGSYVFQNIIDSGVQVDPIDPLSPVGYALRTQIYTANTADPPVFETVIDVWNLNGQADGVRRVGSCLWPDNP
jgi:hypothetical protein